MRKLGLLLVVVLLVFAYVNRQRLFVRDPLGSVERDGVKEDGAQVYVNYGNDALLENDHAPMYLAILQLGQPVGVPDGLKCIHYFLCLTDGYPARQAAALPDTRLESMTGRRVSFHDAGHEVVVKLR